jgi:hypothetical protein
MVGGSATQIGRNSADYREIMPNLVDFDAVATPPGSYRIHSAERGPHWIAWVSRDEAGKPERSVVLVAETREEAEKRAERWAQQSSY